MKNGEDKEHVTKGMLDEAVDAILEGMNKMMGDMRTDMNTRFDKLETKMDSNDNALKDEIEGLKAEFSDTPSRGEFDELKSRVGKHYPLSS